MPRSDGIQGFQPCRLLECVCPASPNKTTKDVPYATIAYHCLPNRQLLPTPPCQGQRRIARAQRQVSDAAERGRWDQVHQKKRRLANLRSQLVGLEADITEGLVRLCFGSKRLWRKQHDLEANGYSSHEEWLQDWRAARGDEFFVLGSRDKTAGCQLCVARIADDGWCLGNNLLSIVV